MARIWKIVRHGSPDEWEESIPEESLAEGQLVTLLGRLAASHLPHAVTHPTSRNAPRYTTSLTVKNDRLLFALVMRRDTVRRERKLRPQSGKALLI